MIHSINQPRSDDNQRHQEKNTNKRHARMSEGEESIHHYRYCSKQVPQAFGGENWSNNSQMWCFCSSSFSMVMRRADRRFLLPPHCNSSTHLQITHITTLYFSITTPTPTCKHSSLPLCSCPSQLQHPPASNPYCRFVVFHGGYVCAESDPDSFLQVSSWDDPVWLTGC